MPLIIGADITEEATQCVGLHFLRSNGHEEPYGYSQILYNLVCSINSLFFGCEKKEDEGGNNNNDFPFVIPSEFDCWKQKLQFHSKCC